MRSLVIALAALVAVSCLAQPVSAFGGFLGIGANVHNRAQNRQQQRQFNHQVKQLNFVAPVYYAPAQLVAPIYVAPIRAAYIAPQPINQSYVAPQPVCCAPIVQGYRQQVGVGCQSFFAH